MKTQLFLYEYGFGPHVSDENDQWKRNFSKTLRTHYQFQSTTRKIRNLFKMPDGRSPFLSFILGLISDLIACFQANLALLILQADYSRRRQNIREIKIHVYSIRQTANVSGEFLRIENKQLRKVQNDSCGQNYHKTTYFCVEAMNGKRKIGGKLGHVVQIYVCRLA